MAVDENRAPVHAITRDVRNVVSAIDAHAPSDRFDCVGEHVVGDILGLMSDLALQIHEKTPVAQES
jgi:hypothetical protein